MGYLGIFLLLLIAGSAAFLLYKAWRKSKSRGLNPRKLDLLIAQLTMEMRRSPNNAVLCCKRGIARQKKGDLTGALTDLGRALALDPGLSEAHFQRGAVLERTGDLSGAENEFDWIVTSGNDPFYGTAAQERLDQLRAKKKSG